MLGTNPDSDVMAHLFGLLAGLGVGISLLPLVGWFQIKRPVIQLISFATCLGLIYYSWQIQLTLG